MDKVIIADSAEMFSAELKSMLAPEVIAECCCCARELMDALLAGRPSLLVLNLSLPGCDGMELLRQLATNQDAPPVLAVADYVSDFVRSTLAGIGIGFLLVKPCKLETVADRIRDMLQYYASNPACEDIVCKTKIPENLSGTAYIRYGLPLLMENPDLQLTKELYPMIACKFGKKPHSVERSIRSVVHGTWQKHDGFIWQQYMHCDTTGRSMRPSNADFFRMLLDMIRMAG